MKRIIGTVLAGVIAVSVFAQMLLPVSASVLGAANYRTAKVTNDSQIFGRYGKVMAVTRLTDGRYVAVGFTHDEVNPKSYYYPLQDMVRGNSALMVTYDNMTNMAAGIGAVARGSEAVGLRGVTATSDGGYVVTGAYQKSNYSAYAYIAKYDSGGQLLWEHINGSSSSEVGYFNAAVEAEDGTILAVGGQGNDGFIYRYNADGTHQKSTSALIYGNSGTDHFTDAMLDGNGNIIVSGACSGDKVYQKTPINNNCASTVEANAFVISVNISSGAINWSQVYQSQYKGETIQGGSQFQSLAMSDGVIYAAGSTSSQRGDFNTDALRTHQAEYSSAFIASFDSESGEKLSARTVAAGKTDDKYKYIENAMITDIEVYNGKIIAGGTTQLGGSVPPFYEAPFYGVVYQFDSDLVLEDAYRVTENSASDTTGFIVNDLVIADQNNMILFGQRSSVTAKQNDGVLTERTERAVSGFINWPGSGVANVKSISLTGSDDGTQGSVPNSPYVNAVSESDAVVTGISEPNASIEVKVGSDTATYTATAAASGSFSVAIPKQTVGTAVSVWASNSYGKSVATQITVQAVPAPATPTVNPVSDQDNTVSGSGTPGNKIIISNGVSEYSGYVGDDGTFRVTIDPQLGNTELTLKAFNNAGVASSEVKVKVAHTIGAVIYASDRTVRVGDNVNLLENISAFDAVDGDLSQYVVVAKSDLDLTTPGKYNVTYAVLDRGNNRTEKVVQVTVVESAPIIYANDKNIILNSEFDPLEGVSATDYYGKDLTPYIVITNNDVDTTVAGEYNVTYRVRDDYGSISETTITVTVNGNNIPVITAQDITVTQGGTFDPLQGVTATDFEDGDLTEHIVYVSNVNTNVAGEYALTYKVLDNNGGLATKTIKVTVVSAMPVISADNQTIIAGTPFDPFNGVSAADYYGKDLTQFIIVRSNTVDNQTPGTYSVTYAVMDNFGNVAEKTITVTVVANHLPTITAQDITVIQGNDFDPLKNVTATDFEDGDLTKYIVYVSNVNTDVAGAYSLTYKVLDNNGGLATKTVTVTVVSNMPVIYAENKTINVGANYNPMSGVTAYDAYGKDLTQYLAISYNNVDVNTPGTYNVTYAILDDYGNKTYKTITITVEL